MGAAARGREGLTLLHGVTMSVEKLDIMKGQLRVQVRSSPLIGLVVIV